MGIVTNFGKAKLPERGNLARRNDAKAAHWERMVQPAHVQLNVHADAKLTDVNEEGRIHST
jgi:hypothetical protein